MDIEALSGKSAGALDQAEQQYDLEGMSSHELVAHCGVFSGLFLSKDRPDLAARTLDRGLKYSPESGKLSLMRTQLFECDSPEQSLARLKRIATLTLDSDDVGLLKQSVRQFLESLENGEVKEECCRLQMQISTLKPSIKS